MVSEVLNPCLINYTALAGGEAEHGSQKVESESQKPGAKMSFPKACPQ